MLAGITAGSLATKPTALRISAPAPRLPGQGRDREREGAGIGCELSVRYSDGQKQSDMFPTQVRNGTVSWNWQVPDFAAPGPRS